MENNEKTPNLLEEYGLEVTAGEVEEGKTYPIFGMVTKILNDIPGEVEVELNFSIIAKMNLPTPAKVELLKKRAFEPGIFLSKILTKSDTMIVDCQTVIFGKQLTKPV